MKASATTSMQLGQQLHMTPQLLQSIRLLQLDGLQLELEIRRVLEQNPLLELDEEPVASPVPERADAATEVAAFDELPESSMWDVRGAGWSGDDDDGLQRIAAGESSDPHLRILQRLASELDAGDLEIAAADRRRRPRFRTEARASCCAGPGRRVRTSSAAGTRPWRRGGSDPAGGRCRRSSRW